MPAVVEYPVNVTQRTVTLQSPKSTVQWTADFHIAADDELAVDKVIRTLAIPEYDKIVKTLNLTPGTHCTLGRISLAFSTLFDSSIVIKSDVTNFGADESVQGSFAAPYAHFFQGTETADAALNNTFSSPMAALLSNIRDVMFISSVAIAQNEIKAYAGTNTADPVEDELTASVPAVKVTNLGEYHVYHTVYTTNRLILGLSISLISLAVLDILPLFWGYWRLGRKVSLSPVEVAKAIHGSTVRRDGDSGIRTATSVLDVPAQHGGRVQIGSNLSADELVEVLGDAKVRYGEVAPDILGMGSSEYTTPARRGGCIDSDQYLHVLLVRSVSIRMS